MKQPPAQPSSEIVPHDGFADPRSYYQEPNEPIADERGKIIAQVEIGWRQPLSDKELLKIGGGLAAGLEVTRLIFPLIRYDYGVLNTILMAAPAAIGLGMGIVGGYKLAQAFNKRPLIFVPVCAALCYTTGNVVSNAIEARFQQDVQKQKTEKPVISLLDANAEEMLQLVQSAPAYICQFNQPALNG
jgi:hypothetical protein